MVHKHVNPSCLKRIPGINLSPANKPDKGNGVVILDRKLYDNAIPEIISDTSKFERLTEDLTLKREASLQRFYIS